MTANALSHLHPTARPIAIMADEERIRHIKTDKWIQYPRAEAALERLTDLVDTPTRTRMPCLLLYGDSGIGKTMIIEKFLRNYPGVFNVQDGIEHRPVISMQMPSAPDERRFYLQLLNAVGAPVSSHMRLQQLESVALRVVKALSPNTIVIDEVHNLIAGSFREQRRALNLLKFLANELHVSIVACGTADALHAMQSDLQVASRFEPFQLPRWNENREFLAFLGTLVKIMPLRKPSDLLNRPATGLLLSRGFGITGLIVRILTRAAVLAIRTGAEHINIDLLEKVSIDMHLNGTPH
jgi:hypothetical protein